MMVLTRDVSKGCVSLSRNTGLTIRMAAICRNASSTTHTAFCAVHRVRWVGVLSGSSCTHGSPVAELPRALVAPIMAKSLTSPEKLGLVTLSKG